MPNASNPNASDYQYYWGTIVDALACIYLYQVAVTDDFKHLARYEEFPVAVNHARAAYYYCEPLPVTAFGMVGEDIDRFFQGMLDNDARLDSCYSKALDNHCAGAKPVPMCQL